MDSFLGVRGGRVKDQFGNIWWIITRVEDLSDEEKGRRAGEQINLDNMAIAIKTFDEELRSWKSEGRGFIHNR